VHFCRREPQGQLDRNERVIHHHSSALGHFPAAETKNEIRKGSIKVKKKETLVKRQYLSGGNFVFRVDLLQHRTQSSSENMSFPHQPPPIKINSRRSEDKIGRDR
jgi:hypothetical protein